MQLPSIALLPCFTFTMPLTMLDFYHASLLPGLTYTIPDFHHAWIFPCLNVTMPDLPCLTFAMPDFTMPEFCHPWLLPYLDFSHAWRLPCQTLTRSRCSLHICPNLAGHLCYPRLLWTNLKQMFSFSFWLYSVVFLFTSLHLILFSWLLSSASLTAVYHRFSYFENILCSQSSVWLSFMRPRRFFLSICSPRWRQPRHYSSKKFPFLLCLSTHPLRIIAPTYFFQLLP